MFEMVETLCLFMDKTSLLLRIVKHSPLFCAVPRDAWKVNGHKLQRTEPQRLGSATQAWYPKAQESQRVPKALKQ